MAMLLNSSACARTSGLASCALSDTSLRRSKTSAALGVGGFRVQALAAGRVNRNGLLRDPMFLGFKGSSLVENRVRSSSFDLLDSRGAKSGALGTSCTLPASVETLRWIFVAAAAALLLIKNVAIPKQYLVPLLALELPRDVFSWIRGEYGLWTAFVALLVKLFYQIPEDLRLPLYTILLVIAAPAQATQYRGSTPAALASLVLSVYLGVEHYRAVGDVKAAFKSDRLVPTIAILALVTVSVLFFFNTVTV